MTKYITCKVCGRQFPARSQWPNQCYCSHDCKRRARSLYNAQWRATNPSPGSDSASCEFCKKLRKQDRAEHERLMVALTQWDYICKAASPIRVTVARVGRAVVESRGKIPIHNSKKWAMA